MHNYNKKPSIVYWLGDSIYLNLTNKCPNCCSFCVRNFKDGINDFNLRLENEPTVKEIIKELRNVIDHKNWREIVFCGFGEPLERLDAVLEITGWIKLHHSKMMVRVNTNGQGYLLNKGRDVARELKNSGVDKVSVSLNANNKGTYNQICKPVFNNAYENVLEFIKKAKEIMETEATAVTVPEVDLTKVGELAKNVGVKFTVRECTLFCGNDG